MKKEIRIQLHFVLIVLLTSGAFLTLTWIQGISEEMISELRTLLLAWLFAFLAICGLRLAYVGSFKASPDSSESRNVSNEIPLTLTYGVMGIVSVFLTWPLRIFLLLFQLPNDMSPNMLEMWLNFRPVAFALLIGFTILALARLALIKFLGSGKFS